MRQHIKNIAAILLGTALYAFSINYFTLANRLAEGGFTGVGILLNYYFAIPLAWSNLILNIPLFILSWKILGRKMFAYTMLGVFSLSLFLMLTARFQEPLQDDLLLAALYAGFTAGLGLGIVFRFGGTTGGVDILARLAYKYFGWSMGRTMFMFDFAVIALSYFIIGREKAMYTIVAVFIAARMVDFIQEGAYANKAVTIVSDQPEKIAGLIHTLMERGTTLLQAKGGYTKTMKEVVYCVVSRSEINRLKDIVYQTDPKAFIVVSDAYDVLGEGFTWK
jgi:uncharacterized membrane-anchored protein YitT (DUF2179 family)